MEYIPKKLSLTYGTIKKISKYFDKNILLLLYNSLIISHIRYGIGTWYNGNKIAVQKIQQIVNKFIRMIFVLHHRASVTNIMKDNGILTIDQINKLELCSFMYKYTKNLLPPCFFNLFQHNIVGNDSQISTRSQSKFFPSFSRLNMTKQTLKYRCPILWNIVPHRLRESGSYKNFRKEFLKYLIEKEAFKKKNKFNKLLLVAVIFFRKLQII